MLQVAGGIRLLDGIDVKAGGLCPILARIRCISAIARKGLCTSSGMAAEDAPDFLEPLGAGAGEIDSVRPW